MATEVLVNDGGAPARIIPLTAGATISGGHILDMQTDGEVDPAKQILVSTKKPLDSH